MSPLRNLGLALGATLVITGGILLANWHVDPFGLGPAGAEPRSPTERASAKDPFWHKVFAVTYIKPAAVILGTSRAATGLDSAHPGFAENVQPVYNLSTAGASIEQLRQLLVHAHLTRPLRQVVVGLDFESFLDDGRTDFDPAVLAGNKESAPRWLNRVRLNLSWRALGATAAGLNQDDVTPQEFPGHRLKFRAVEINNFHARLPQLFPRWSPNMQWDTEPRRAAAMRVFRDLVSFARDEGIDLRLFISPVHARYLEMYRRVGWWPMFEAWKRALVATLAEDTRTHPGGKVFPLRDFSGFNSITMEAVPHSDDVKTSMRWYIESSHYSREHGNLILDRILEPSRAQDHPEEAGVLIAGHNIELHLRRVRQDADHYRAAFPAEVAEAATITQYLRRARR